MKAVKFEKDINGFTGIRKRLGYSQQELAKQLGVGRSLLSMVELGRRSLPVAALQKLAALEKRQAENDPEKKTIISP